MIRLLFILLLSVTVAYLILAGNTKAPDTALPVFLVKDQIAINHHSDITVKSDAAITPTPYQIALLKKDYQNIWAHLNHLYQTNEVVAGKEYYTEDWFKQLTLQYENNTSNPIQRKDITHELHLKNWSTDALVCTAIDSNLVFEYVYPHQQKRTTKATVAIVLLFQGDHWRLDGMRVLAETIVEN